MAIVVTGATGRLGGRVAASLAAAGARTRLVVRDAARAPRPAGADVVEVQGGYADRPGLTRAFEAADALLFVSAGESPERVTEHRNVVDAAAAAGVGHVVYTSFFGASPDATFLLARDHAATEEFLRGSGLAWTALRDNLYADFVPSLAGEDGVIAGPGGQGRAAFVAIDDVADVATAVLLDPRPHAGAVLDLTGPQSLTLDEAAAIATAALGRPFSYRLETVAQAYASRASYGAPQWMVDGWVSTYTAIAAGELDGVTDVVPRLLGRPATALADLLAGTR